jgi:hypothetical protein
VYAEPAGCSGVLLSGHSVRLPACKACADVYNAESVQCYGGSLEVQVQLLNTLLSPLLGFVLRCGLPRCCEGPSDPMVV